MSKFSILCSTYAQLGRHPVTIKHGKASSWQQAGVADHPWLTRPWENAISTSLRATRNPPIRQTKGRTESTAPVRPFLFAYCILSPAMAGKQVLLEDFSYH